MHCMRITYGFLMLKSAVNSCSFSKGWTENIRVEHVKPFLPGLLAKGVFVEVSAC